MNAMVFAWGLILLLGDSLTLCILFGLYEGLLRPWWKRRNRSLSDVVDDAPDHDGDVNAEDVREPCPEDLRRRRRPGRRGPRVVADFADIAATMPDLDTLDVRLADLYLIPEER